MECITLASPRKAEVTPEPFKAHVYKSDSTLWILELHIRIGIMI